MLGLFSLLGMGANLVNDARIHNQKYFGTEREIQKDNPRVVEGARNYIENIRRNGSRITN